MFYVLSTCMFRDRPNNYFTCINTWTINEYKCTMRDLQMLVYVSHFRITRDQIQMDRATNAYRCDQ